ncbi:hypothetical protein FB45DRAFT_1064394 [Roridomyces roridus]|uniref:Uncharacterized protein n=1 Tax=Roridomyces roridus TaxID=1738132 RepID=A0AAD7FCB3_9AGAR|nr:hypothetical protein FB45DRAFT_1064394 [Roridomyces roridus]
MVAWPQELLEAFVEQIRGKKTLQQCSLASKSLVVACQRRLFHTVSVMEMTDCHRATQHFTAFPHLRSYVRALHATVQPDGQAEWEELASLLPMFPNMARLDWTAGIQWPNVLISALRESLQSPSLQSFNLLVANKFPPSLLSHAAASVSQLGLWHVTLDDRAERAVGVVPRPNLKSLTHRVASKMGNQDTIRLLLPHLSGLEKLEDDLTSASQSKLIMEASHRSLKKLSLPDLDIPKLAHIPRTLRMDSLLVLHVGFVWRASPEHCLISLFRELPPPSCMPQLETLSVRIGPADKVPVHAHNASGLGPILDSHTRLRAFEVELRWSLPPDDGTFPLAEYIQAQTPTRIRVTISNRKDKE